MFPVTNLKHYIKNKAEVVPPMISSWENYKLIKEQSPEAHVYQKIQANLHLPCIETHCHRRENKINKNKETISIPTRNNTQYATHNWKSFAYMYSFLTISLSLNVIEYHL